jgi:hypothetical protein
MMKVLLIVTIVLFLFGVCLAQEGDILDFAAKHPLGAVIINPDETYRYPKFGDYRLERAVEELKNYPRPWTVAKVLAWYDKAEDGKIRAHLLWVLAASRDPRAALALGNALNDDSLDVRVAATYGLLDYFMKIVVGGGTEQHIIAVKEWWEKNQESIQKEAERLTPKTTPNNGMHPTPRQRASHESCAGRG